MNVVALMGRLTRDPEIKFGQSGKAYCRFSIAVNRPFSKDETDFFNCVAFGRTAEILGEYFRKGQQISLNGRLQMNQYEVNGEKRTSYDVVIEAFDFIGTKGGNGDSRPSYEETNMSKPSPSNKNTSFQENLESEADFEDEFPF